MARLFITPREIDYINDLAAEIVKDVIGQFVYFYSISREKSRIHDVYGESINKIFENPIKLDCRVDWQPADVYANEFGIEQVRTLKVYVQSRDMIKKNIEIKEGDFIAYGSQFFEIVKAVAMRTIYGQVEYLDGFEITCKEARQDQFITKILGPKGEEYSDEDAVQKKFVQQRGFENNSEGPTGDERDLQRRGVLTEPISQPREVSEDGDTNDSSSFYDEG